jgi:thioredoxin-dependent peroxiredoxin
LFLTVKVGDKAPDFTLPSQMGDNVTLSEYFGKKNVVLYFYPKDETTGCTREACSFRDSYEELTSLDAEVLGISGQSVESHKSFATHYGLQFILLADVGDRVRELYGVPKTMGFLPGRVTYIIDKKGFVRQVFVSQTQTAKHVLEAKDTLIQLQKEEKYEAAPHVTAT